MKNTDDMKKSLLGSNDGEPSYQKPSAYAPPLEEQNFGDLDQHFPQTVFIDTLSSTKEITREGQKQIVADEAAQGRIQALRNMRFKPHLEYAARIREERLHNQNPGNPDTLFHGVRFLKPLNGFPLTFDQTDFRSQNIKVVNHGFFKRMFRAVAILLTLPFFGRPIWKSTRIEEGEFGFAKDADGNIEIYNSGKGYQTGLSLWTSIQKRSIDSDYVNMFNRVHMIKVKQGEYALGELNGHPVVLPPGRHMIESPQFTLKTLNNDGTTPHFFKHTDSVVKYGNTHIVRVPPGKVARANLGGRIVILEPEYSQFDRDHGTGIGAYVVHDQNFELLPVNAQNPAEGYFHDINKSLVNLDPARVLTVPQTKAAVVEHNGNKVFLRGGRYALPDATYVYNPTITARNANGQQVQVDAMYDLTDRLVTISTANDTPLMSNDKIRLQIEASLLFTVVDVEACDLKVGVADYIENTKQRARNKLYELVSKGNYLQPIAGKNQPSNQASSSREVVPYNEELARRQITADFANQVYEELSRELDQSSGIRLEKVLITSLIIQDPNVRTQVESEATQAASANAALSAAKISQETAVITAETAKRQALIQAQQRAEELLITTRSRTEAQVVEGTAANRVMQEKAGAELEVSQRKAETEAKNTVTVAQAKAQATVAVATADRDAAVLRATGAKAFDTPAIQNIPAIEAVSNGSHMLLDGAKVTLIGQSANEVGKMAFFSDALSSFIGKPGSTVIEHDRSANDNKQKVVVN